MSRTRFLVAPLLAVIIVGLLVVGGWAIHRIGWSEGYAVGQLTDGGGELSTPPYAPIGLGYLGLFLTAGLAFLVLVMIVGKLFRFWAWKTAALPWMMAGGPWKQAVGPNGEPWIRYWRRHHRHVPPWWGEMPSQEASAGEAQPGEKADTAGAES